MYFSINLVILACGFLGSFVFAANSVDVCSSCTYKSVTSALDSLPADSTVWTISIAPGTYTEQVKISRSNVILKPSASGKVQIQYNGMRDTQTSTGTNEQSATISVYGSNVKIYDMIIANIYPQTTNIANLALNLQATQASFYNVKFYGFQDTVLIATGATSYFKSCYIEGSVDYIWGYGVAYFEATTLGTNKRGGYITAHKRKDATSVGGFYFNGCTVIPTIPSGPLTSTADPSQSFTSASQFPNSCYLGRPWNQYARVVYMNSELYSHINSGGWAKWSTSSPNTDGVLFGEYNNSGPGKWNATTRVSFATLLTETEASSYSLGSIFGSINWIDTIA
ncbi:carbohydrate esterase family 8 protein [Phycomyces blakesleeanus]|uniref:pectinesterase n=2 Tax=Phycomyces blakesleeanus TaxID=4837 RepID=A0A167QED7_PHYB8|nr:carbohydrate esterase family 8 protein [Phycomyces blakesleeanus NRRL 1555(-)]OAD79579.1 carbohydrate esterase family 8 protein [Phycomyces blakesleeanus NRRL 1555(-)]|eukprot:XP_018297619.1 carbohydrate esterase family 8 protein [Phycomyces blakesleeanus NRRL 1555(-)]